MKNCRRVMRISTLIIGWTLKRFCKEVKGHSDVNHVIILKYGIVFFSLTVELSMPEMSIKVKSSLNVKYINFVTWNIPVSMTTTENNEQTLSHLKKKSSTFSLFLIFLSYTNN